MQLEIVHLHIQPMMNLQTEGEITGNISHCT